MGHLRPGFVRDCTVTHLPQKALFLLTGLWVGEGVGVISHVNYIAVSQLERSVVLWSEVHVG